VSQKKLDTFSFEHNFGKYDPILIILSLLQTAINHDKAYHKIYHHTSNLLVYYLVKWTDCIGQRCWHDFVIKDVTIKQVALNVKDMDKINIVSLQAVLEMFSFSTDTRTMSSSPLVNSLVKNRLFETAPDIDEPDWAAVSIHPHYGFVCGRHDAAWHPRSRNPQDWDMGCLEATGWTQESLAFLDAAFQLLHVRGAVCRFTVLLEHKVVTRYSAYLWQQEVWRHYDVAKQHGRSQ